MFRCPYCGKKAFLLNTKLGVNTNLEMAPRCPICKKVVFRNFVMGGHLMYSVILGLAAFCTIFGIVISRKLDFNFGTILFPVLLVVFYLVYNYYFCYFDIPIKKCVFARTMNIQLKECDNVWPNIRKGEIYELLPADVREPYYEDMYTIGMVEKIQKGEICFRIIKN
ncbi:MAG: hypothetical protein IJN03_03145, partial [Bacilli bacterium]|nr:hypothetical protein [Bacilli bacterium]